MTRWSIMLVAVPLALGSLAAQGSPDRDRTALPAGQSPAPNGTRVLPDGSVRNAWYVQSYTSWSDERYAVGTSAAPCDLVVTAGGTLDVTGAMVDVTGNVVLEPGGLLRLRDSELRLLGVAPHDYGFHFVGGQLETLRAAIGGNPSTGAVSNVFLDKGLWTARDTVVSYTGGILVGSPLGRDGDPLRNGGTLLADGLIAGPASDYVHLSGKGNVTLHNSAVRISLRFFDTGPTPTPVPLALPSGVLVAGPVVFGDPAVHDGTNRPAVTTAIPGSPWRLELRNTTVTKWHAQFYEVGAGTSQRTYEFHDTPDIAIAVQGSDVTGSPVRSGPWTTYYPPPYELPGLPSTSGPGYHGIPPGCGVTIGSVTLRSAPGDWTKVVSWGLYFEGSSSLTITGPSRIGELMLHDDAELTLQGVEGFDAGFRCVTGILTGASRLVIRDATLGSEAEMFGSLLATGQSTVDIDRVRLRRLLLRTGSQSQGGVYNGVDAATISLGHHVRSPVDGETFTVSQSPGGTITYGDGEFANVDFEGAVSGGTPQHWATSGVSCTPSTSVPPSSPGARSVLYQSNASSGALRRTAMLPQRTPVEVHAWVRPGSMPAGSYALQLRDASGNAVSASLPTSGGWQFVSLPPFTVAPGQNQVTLEFVHSGTAGQVSFRVDDVVVRTPGYWESDNLLNLGFEEPRQRRDEPSQNATDGPDYWHTLFAHGESITTGLRAGATGRAVRLDVDGEKGVLRKNLYFPLPGQQIVVTGWVKAVGATGGSFFVDAYVGTGNRYWDPSIPSTQWLRMFGPGQWTQFSLTYTVPAPPEFLGWTTIAIAGGATGDHLYVDDVTVTIQ